VGEATFSIVCPGSDLTKILENLPRK